MVTFTSDGQDLTDKPISEVMKAKGPWQLDIYSVDGQFFPVDTYRVKKDMSNATGEVYRVTSGTQSEPEFETVTPGYVPK